MRTPILDRLIRLVLRLYPESFRRRYGSEITASFHRLVELKSRSGRGEAIAARVVGLLDLARGAWRERRLQGRLVERMLPSRNPRGAPFEGWTRDLRYAARHLRRRPLFTLVAAGSLAIGIGSNTAVFALANSLFLEALPGIRHYDRVVELGRTSQGMGFDTFTYPDFVDIRSEISALEAAAAYEFDNVSVSRGAEGVRALGFHVSPSYFEVVGAAPGLGRYFVADEAIGLGQHPVTVLSNRFWRDRLGAESDIVGSTLYINRVAYTVVGVTPSEFQGHMVGFVPDLYMPMMQFPIMNGGRNDFSARGSSWHLAIGLLSDGATLDQLNRQLLALGGRLEAAYPDTNRGRGFRAIPLGPMPGAARTAAQLFVGALLGMTALILMVTCMNLAGMLLARALSREREVAVRLSLGAGRGTLVRLLTAETLILVLVGGALGLGLGLWVVGLLRADLLPIPLPVRFSVEPDATVALFALGLTLVTGLLFGGWPAVRATRLDVASVMKGEGPGGGRRSGRLRLGFAGAQVGLTLVLLAAAALFVRSLHGAASVDVGFDPEDAYVTYLDLLLEGYDEAGGLRLHRELLSSLRGLGWATSASLSSDLPLDLGSSGTAVRPEGWDQAESAPLLPVDFNVVTDGYFETLGIPLRTGRSFRETDDAAAPLVAVVSERFGEEAWPGEQVLGRTIQFGSRSLETPRMEIVGVAADTKNQAITDAPKAFVYLPQAQRYGPGIHVAVRGTAPRAEAIQGLRDAITRVDPNISLGPISTLGQYTALGTLPQRIAAWLTTGLGALALLLSGLGIYGVVSYAVGRQQREIGVRMALGADRRSVAVRFLLSGLKLSLPGLLIGGGLALLVGRAVQSLLLDLNPYDPLALGSVSALLLLVVTLAAWIPARRAAGVDPAESLRGD